MKLLILSDSHREMKNMRLAIDREAPDAVFHLGDHDSDAAQLQEEFPSLPIYSVTGNCDGLFPCAPEMLVTELEGVRIFAVHGHKHHVKYGLLSFVMAAKEQNAKLALFGHTHSPYCEDYDGLWLLNPGSCKGYGASYALAYVYQGRVVRCETKFIV